MRHGRPNLIDRERSVCRQELQAWLTLVNDMVQFSGIVGLAHHRVAVMDLSDMERESVGNKDCTVWIRYNRENYQLPETE